MAGKIVHFSCEGLRVFLPYRIYQIDMTITKINRAKSDVSNGNYAYESESPRWEGDGGEWRRL
jgi:hypothetical protein